jgi:5,10-methylenetetrahydromethanopterin reductase
MFARAADVAPLVRGISLTGTREQRRDRVHGLAASGVTEIAYQPAGPDIGRELSAFASATGIGTS